MNDNFVEQQLREMSKTIKNIREIYGMEEKGELKNSPRFH